MVFVKDKKYACERCIKGHRSSVCQHIDRPLFEIKRKGRPVTQCKHCRELRKTKQVHVKCDCEGKEQDMEDVVNHSIPAKKANRKAVGPVDAAFPNGLSGVIADLSPTVEQPTSSCLCKVAGDAVCKCCTPRRTKGHQISKSEDKILSRSPGPRDMTTTQSPLPQLEISIPKPQSNRHRPIAMSMQSSPIEPIFARPRSRSHSHPNVRSASPVSGASAAIGHGPVHDPSLNVPHTHAHLAQHYSPYGSAYDQAHPHGRYSHSQESLESPMSASSQPEINFGTHLTVPGTMPRHTTTNISVGDWNLDILHSPVEDAMFADTSPTRESNSFADWSPTSPVTYEALIAQEQASTNAVQNRPTKSLCSCPAPCRCSNNGCGATAVPTIELSLDGEEGCHIPGACINCLECINRTSWDANGSTSSISIPCHNQQQQQQSTSLSLPGSPYPDFDMSSSKSDIGDLDLDLDLDAVLWPNTSNNQMLSTPSNPYLSSTFSTSLPNLPNLTNMSTNVSPIRNLSSPSSAEDIPFIGESSAMSRSSADYPAVHIIPPAPPPMDYEGGLSLSPVSSSQLFAPSTNGNSMVGSRALKPESDWEGYSLAITEHASLSRSSSSASSSSLSMASSSHLSLGPTLARSSFEEQRIDDNGLRNHVQQGPGQSIPSSTSSRKNLRPNMRLLVPKGAPVVPQQDIGSPMQGVGHNASPPQSSNPLARMKAKTQAFFSVSSDPTPLDFNATLPQSQYRFKM